MSEESIQLEKDFREWWEENRIRPYNSQVDEHDLIWSVFFDAWLKGLDAGKASE